MNIAKPFSFCLRLGHLCAIALLLLTACGEIDQQTPEQAVKATLSAVEEAAEARSLKDFMRHVSPDYQDHQGYRWDDIQRLVQFEYIRNQNIHIFTDIKQLVIDGDIASVELNAAMASRASDLESNAGRLKANTHQFSLVLRQQNDPTVWLIESVSWKRGWQ